MSRRKERSINELPETPRHVVRLKVHEAVLLGGLGALCRVTGRWRYPPVANTDLERMRLVDKAYWLHKARNPMKRARRGSSLEAFFEAQRQHVWSLPPDLRVEQEVSVSAVGDLMSHAYLSRSGEVLYRDVDDLVFGSDLAMANLEGVIQPRDAGMLEISIRTGPSLHLGPSDFEVVKGFHGRMYGFVATACNHSLDHGAEGVDDTIRALRQEGIAFHGTNAPDADAASATIVDRLGVRIAVVSFTFGLNARRPPPDRPGIVNRMRLDGTAADVDLGLLRAQLRSARAGGADFVVAQLHWGLEFELYPAPEQLGVAHLLAEEGVDAIIGHHPHVIQPIEHYRTRRDPARVVPIFYSLGNLTNPWSAPFLCRSAVARLALARGAWVDGSRRTYVRHASATEVVQVADRERRTIALRRAE
jgi:poly-gamma-glutamate synthesis protein (capsule biosynthesis protein)